MGEAPGNQPAKVVYLTRPMAGGMRIHLDLLLSSLDPDRFRPVLLAPEPLAAGASHHRVVLADGLGLKDLTAATAIWRFLRLERPGLCHLHGRKALLVGAPLARRLGIPYVYTVHGFPNALAGSAWENRWLRQAAAVILVSPALIPWAKARGLKSWVVVPNALRPEVLSLTWQGHPDGDQLVTVARLAPEKGVDLLIRALRDLPASRLRIIGSGPEEGHLRHLADELGVSGRITFEGTVPDPGPLMAQADVYVQPSRSEGFGLATLEALAIGLPVVASDVGGLPELLGRGQRGWLFPPEDPLALAAVLQGLRGDPQATARRTAGRDYAREFTVARLGNETMAVYNRVLGISK